MGTEEIVDIPVYIRSDGLILRPGQVVAVDRQPMSDLIWNTVQEFWTPGTVKRLAVKHLRSKADLSACYATLVTFGDEERESSYTFEVSEIKLEIQSEAVSIVGDFAGTSVKFDRYPPKVDRYIFHILHLGKESALWLVFIPSRVITKSFFPFFKFWFS